MMDKFKKESAVVAESLSLFNESANPRLAQRQPASLNKRTAQWLSELPANVRPAQVAVRLPHIANKLALLWSTPDACGEYLDELMLDLRGDRKGFPDDIALELAVLKKHHESVVRRRSQHNAWNAIIVR